MHLSFIDRCCNIQWNVVTIRTCVWLNIYCISNGEGASVMIHIQLVTNANDATSAVGTQIKRAFDTSNATFLDLAVLELSVDINILIILK